MDSIERLEKEVLELNNSNITAIFNYLKNRKDLYDKFNNKEKSVKQMYDYICNQAEKQKIGKVAMIADNLVYLWAVSYFLKSNEELGLNKKETKTKKNAEEKETKESEKLMQIHQKAIKLIKNNDNQLSMFEEVQK